MKTEFIEYYKLKMSLSHENAITHADLYSSGTVYTPESASKKLIYMGLTKYMDFNYSKFSEVLHDTYAAFMNQEIYKPSEAHESRIAQLHKILVNLTVADLSSGTGMILFTYIEYILYLGNLISLAPSNYLKNLFENRVVAIDINSEAISSYRTLGEKMCACAGIESVIPQAFIGNALLDTFPIAENTFDIVFGNPPYIGEKGNTDIFKLIKESPFGKIHYEGKMDYFYFFIYRGYDYLKVNGVLSYLTSNYFFTADGAKKLRAFIQNHFFITSILNFDTQKVFDEKKLHAAIFTLQKNEPKVTDLLDYSCNRIAQIPYADIFNESGYLNFIHNPLLIEIFNKIKAQRACILCDEYVVKQGIVTGADRKEGKGVFVYHESELEDLPKSIRSSIKPLYKNSSIDHYHIKGRPKFHLVYDTNSPEIPTLLEPYKEHLSKRREVKNGVRKWFELTWPRNPEIFKGPKLVCPQRGKANYFAYTDEDFYASADVYFIKATSSSSYSLKVLGLILNTKIYKIWLQSNGKRKGDLLELYATPLKNLPLPKLSIETVRQLEEYSCVIFDTFSGSDTKSKTISDIDCIVYQAFQLSESEIDFLKSLD